MSLLCLPPLANNASVLIPPLVVSFWYPPLQLEQHISNLVCFVLEDQPNNEFFDQALLFLPTDIRGAFMHHKQSSVFEKHHFSNTLQQGMDGKWHSSVTISLLENPANLVTVQDSSNCDSLDASQVPNCVLMDSNQGIKDLSQASNCTELDHHTCSLSPTANWGFTVDASFPSVQPDPNSTPTAGNVS